VEINFKKLNFLVEPKNYQSFWDNFLSWEQDDLNFVTEKGEQDKIFPSKNIFSIANIFKSK